MRRVSESSDSGGMFMLSAGVTWLLAEYLRSESVRHAGGEKDLPSGMQYVCTWGCTGSR